MELVYIGSMDMPLISITLPSQQLFQDLVLVIAGTISHGQMSRVGGHEESEVGIHVMIPFRPIRTKLLYFRLRFRQFSLRFLTRHTYQGLSFLG